jgi:two-component system response regulator VicR
LLDKILIVDDEPDIVNLVRVILERDGYWVVSASSGDEALGMVNSEAPDLVLLDLVMPGKSGLEVCKILKSQGNTKNVPVIMFTALGRDVDKKLSSWAGADAHFTKPFTPAQLSAEVKRWLIQAKATKFSGQLGLDHYKMRGRKILLEFDPRSDYERLIRDFAIEAVFYDETTIAITQRSSTIHQALEGNENVRFVDLDPLMKFSAILNQNPDGPLSLVFDSLTDLALLQKSAEIGYKTGYKFAQNALQVLIGPRVTAVFLLNPGAHEPQDVASFRGLFNNQASYDTQGVTVVRVSENSNPAHRATDMTNQKPALALEQADRGDGTGS